MILFFFNAFLAVGLALLWIKNSRPQKEDPRLSRGLQLLQSKIAVLEDLSDRTDTQVKQLVQILEERSKALTSKIVAAQELMGRLDHAMVEGPVPQEEMLERKITSRYVEAAKLAHDGMTAGEISRQLGLPLSEVDFIVKVNKDELSFSPEHLPAWAKSETLDRVLQSHAPDLSSIERVTQQFNSTVDEHRRAEAEVERRQQEAAERRRQFEQRQRELLESAKMATTTVIRKVQFPRLDEM
jgi:hypothetical protein